MPIVPNPSAPGQFTYLFIDDEEAHEKVASLMVEAYDTAIQDSTDEDDEESMDLIGDSPAILANVVRTILSPEGIALMIRQLQDEGADL